jgi:hypothetical protein
MESNRENGALNAPNSSGLDLIASFIWITFNPAIFG